MVRNISAVIILIVMILAAIYDVGDLFLLIMGPIFILAGVATIVRYRKTGEMIESLKVYEQLRGKKTALFMGGLFFALITLFYVFYLFQYLTRAC